MDDEISSYLLVWWPFVATLLLLLLALCLYRPGQHPAVGCCHNDEYFQDSCNRSDRTGQEETVRENCELQRISGPLSNIKGADAVPSTTVTLDKEQDSGAFTENTGNNVDMMEDESWDSIDLEDRKHENSKV